MDKDNRQGLQDAESSGDAGQAQDLMARKNRNLQAVVDTLPAHTAVLDGRGIIIEVNQAWMRFAVENGLLDTRGVCEGADYLSVCRRAADMDDPLAREALEGIEAVLRAELPTFTLEYPCHSPTQQRWFVMEVRRSGDGSRTVITHLNITDRKLAQKQFQQERVFNEAILNNIPGMLVLYDASGRLVRWNKQHEAITGYSAGEMATMHLLDWFGGREPTTSMVRREMETIFAKGRAEVEASLVTRDGRLLPCLFTGVVLTIAGSPYVLGIGIDITERKQAEGALRRSETRYRTLFETAQDAIIIMRGEFCTECNPRASEMFGCHRDQIVGQTPMALSPALQPDGRDSAEKAREIIREAYAGTTMSFEWRHVRCDGTEFDAEVRLSAMSFDDQSMLLALVRDITDRKRATDALRSSEARLRSIFLAVPIGVGVVANRRFVEVNQRMCEMTGFSRDELLRMQSTRMIYPSQEEFERIGRENYGQVAGKGEGVMETRWRRKDGSENDVLLSSTAIDPDDIRVGITFAALDITERKRFEEELRRTSEDLRRSNQDLEQFAYVVSHDLQEPLRMVTEFMKLLKSYSEGRLDSTSNEYIAFAVDGAHRMQQLIHDLLAYAHAGTRGEDLREISVQAAFDRAVADLWRVISDAGAEITHDPLPMVCADETQLTQVFLNLFGNAIKFRGDKPPRIHLCVRRERGEWVFSVRDNGIGIDPKSFGRVFEVFQRLHTREEYQGSGIGLAVCKKIVERHGGRIWVESQLGQGTTFLFTLPVR